MKKKLLLSVMAATILSSSITVCAAPQYMADGAVFDPEYYLEQNPDVAGWPLGTSADALYTHYTTYGASEGRKPYNAAALNLANVLPYQDANSAAAEQPADTTQPTVTTQPAASQQNSTDPRAVYGVPDETYQFPSIHTEQYNYANCTVNISSYLVDDADAFPEALEPYTLPGYEWREIGISLTVDGARASDDAYARADMAAILDPYHDCCFTSYVDYNNYATNFENIKEDIGDWITYLWRFTLNQNGTDYTECKVFCQENGGVNEYYYYTWYALVPANFSGELTICYTGMKLENGKPVENESSPVILFRF